MPVRVNITRRDSGLLNRISRRARRLRGGVYVGYFADQGQHDGRSPITLGNLAAIHERGTEHIPKRPFVLPALEQNRNKYGRIMRGRITPIIRDGAPTTEVWQTIGTMAAADVQNYMVSASFTPLKEKTIERKGSSKPLIDTSQLRQSITYRVR